VSTVGAMIGMGPVTYQGPGISKCDEKIIDACNTPTRCCAVVACTYCLEWREYGEDPQYGTATTDDSGNLSGEIAGFLFEAIWQRNEYTNDCELGLWIDGETVGVLPLCGVLDGCNDVSSELTYQVRDSYGNATREGTLIWQKKTLKPLPYRKDENGCTQKFCGNCDCTCKALCVTVTIVGEYIGLDDDLTCTTTLSGTPYDDTCQGPVWEGVVVCGTSERTLAFAMIADPYTGDCVFSAAVDGVPYSFPMTECDGIDFRIELEDNTFIDVRCKDQCEDCESQCPDDACLCETISPAVACGSLVEAYEPGDPCADGGVGVSFGNAITVLEQPWVNGVDQAFGSGSGGGNITIPCGLFPVDLPGVLVRRSADPNAPQAEGVDYSIVEPCDYYYVLYNEDGTLNTIVYEYSMCCSAAFASPTCQTRAAWVKIHRVPLLRGYYDFIYWRPRDADLTDMCGIEENPCEA
jgi:hypothetical protein